VTRDTKGIFLSKAPPFSRKKNVTFHPGRQLSVLWTRKEEKRDTMLIPIVFLLGVIGTRTDAFSVVPPTKSGLPSNDILGFLAKCRPVVAPLYMAGGQKGSNSKQAPMVEDPR
jgi:hypothetical protein